jgi:hypothetical protein
MVAGENKFREFDIRVHRTDAITDDELTVMHQLFDIAYSQANHSYLDKSFGTLKYVARATRGKIPVGFALGETVKTMLPRLADPQIVVLGGICCIAPEYRRQGLFGYLEGLAMRESGLLEPGVRTLACGRMAHPASFHNMMQNPTVIPKYGVPISDWHKEIGLCVADIYGVTLDPDTFVVIGSGSPIGYPKMDIDVPEEEWRLFQAVNRDRGDSLLGIAWAPDAPEGW